MQKRIARARAELKEYGIAMVRKGKGAWLLRMGPVKSKVAYSLREIERMNMGTEAPRGKR